jgi:Flp pilus assembly pilin Flp
MFDTVKSAVADRKGVTALEYALIAAAVVAVIISAAGPMFARLDTLLAGISFADEPITGAPSLTGRAVVEKAPDRGGAPSSAVEKAPDRGRPLLP